MERLPQEIISEINSLSTLDTRAIRSRYAEMLADMPECMISSVLRSVVAYRLQERFYGVSLSAAMSARLDGSDGSTGRFKPVLNGLSPGTRLLRTWKGVQYEVAVRPDGHFEFKGEIYKSLSGIAKAITGTQWNGKLFFGVK